jgi:hypothetical protein
MYHLDFAKSQAATTATTEKSSFMVEQTKSFMNARVFFVVLPCSVPCFHERAHD